MNVHVSKPFDADAYCRMQAERRKRLMGSPSAAKPRPVSPTTKPTEPRVENAVWQREHIWFDAHVETHRKSSKFARSPQMYVERRSLELGFTRKELIMDLKFPPFVIGRRLISHELRSKWGLSTTQIGEQFGRDHSFVLLALRRQRPTEQEASMRLVLSPNDTYLWALERAYYSGDRYQDISKIFKIKKNSIMRIAKRMGWPCRRPELTKEALRDRGRTIKRATAV